MITRIAVATALFSLSVIISRGQTNGKIETICKTPESTIHGFFNCMSGPAGQERDSTLFAQFFYPENFYWHITNTSPALDSVSVVTTFSKRPPVKDTVVVSQYVRWKNDGFHGRAVSIKINRYRNIAQAWVIAEVKPKENESTVRRVQDSFQLYFDGRRWWIMSIAWQPAVAGYPVG
jgi:hypothetical protein